MADYKNFPQFFQYITNLYKDDPVIHWRSEKNKNQYDSISGNKLEELVYNVSRKIEKFNLKPGDRAAIISETRFEWVIADFACIANQIVTVPVYSTMTASQIKFILEHSESKLCFVSTKNICDKVLSVTGGLTNLQKIIMFNKIETDSDRVSYFGDFINTENSVYNKPDAKQYFSLSSLKSNEDDILTIIYTSGTTGDPKGVCLTHKNILSNVRQCDDSFKIITHEDTFLSVLPLCHVYERTAGYYYPLSVGAKIYYAQSIDTLQTQMTETRPTIILCVPLLLTRMHSRFTKAVDAMKGMKKFISVKALSIGKKYRENKNHFLWKLADRKVFRKFREKTGGKIRFFISGGSALNRDTAEFFDAIGLNILQGYGMTEASPVLSVNRPDKNKIGTVGVPLERVKIKIAEDGEILATGDNKMSGYYKNDAETLESIIDGWLHTGDIGEIDNEGFLRITDRKKTLIKTAGGKYISLTHIEDIAGESDYISQVIAFASDERQFVSALVVPDFAELRKFAISQNIPFSSDEELIKNEKIFDFMESEINLKQKDLAKYERIRKFALLPSPFTIESGEMTPTLKLKRKVIENKYKALIDNFYTR